MADFWDLLKGLFFILAYRLYHRTSVARPYRPKLNWWAFLLFKMACDFQDARDSNGQ